MLVARVVHGVKSHFVLRFQEWLMTFMLMQFGLVLLRPGNTFGSSPGYAVMAEIASENMWGAAIVFVATLRFLALLLNGTFRRFRRFSPYVRSITAGLSAFTWFSIAMGILEANTLSTGAGTYTGLTVGDLILAILVAGEAGQAERVHRDGRTARYPN